MAWAVANSNLALVKYWGKADESAKHPASASLSVTLDSISTAADVVFSPELSSDRVEGLPPAAESKVKRFFESFRAKFGVRGYATIFLASNFPIAAGLASSASTFAALSKAAAAAAALTLGDAELAEIARSGSGSACRSIYGGFVEWRPEGGRSVVEPIAAKEHWPLRILVAVTSEKPKTVGSSEGMRRTVATSPYYPAWLRSGADDLAEVRAAIRARDLSRLGTAAERNCLRMHAAAMASVPPLVYWEPATLGAMRRVWELRARGVEAYFSIDAGPQVKVLCEANDAETVKAAMVAVPGVIRVLSSQPGDGPRIVDRPPPWALAGSRSMPRQAVVS
jgi:diphosphomevalonate decarboxylase